MNLLDFIPRYPPHFRSFYEQGKYVDTVIHVGTQSFSAHRLILAHLCPYFRSGLEFKEHLHQKDFVIEDYSPDIFKIVLDALYGIPSSIEDPELQVQVIQLLHFLQIPIDAKIFSSLALEPCQIISLMKDTVGLTKATIQYLPLDVKRLAAEAINLKLERLFCTDDKGRVYLLDKDHIVSTWSLGKNTIWDIVFIPKPEVSPPSAPPLASLAGEQMAVPEYHWVAFADSVSNQILIADASTLSLKKRIKVPDSCFAIAYHKDHLALGLDNGSVAIYNLKNGQMILLPEESAEKETAKPDFDRLLESLHDPSSGAQSQFRGILSQMLKTNRRHRVSSLIFTDQELIVGDWKHQIRIYSIKNWEYLRTIPVEGGIYSMTLLPNNRLIVSGNDMGVQILDLATGHTIKKMNVGEHAYHTLLDPHTIAIYDTSIQIWNLSDWTERGRLVGHTEDVKHVIAYDQYWVSCGEDKTVKIWDPQTYQLVSSVNIDEKVCCLFTLPE